MKPVEALFIVGAVLAPVLAFATWLRLHHLLLADLRSRHNVMWLDLGAPTLFQVIVTRGRPGSGLYGGHLDYGTWLYWKTYRDLHDEKISSLGDQVQRVSGLGPLAVAGTWGATIWYFSKS